MRQWKNHLTSYPNLPTFTEVPLSLTDPYGVSLLSASEYLTPLVTRDTLKDVKADKGVIWVASINGAGKGTDVIWLHCDILPIQPAASASTPPATAVPFDLLLPVETSKSGEETLYGS